MVGSLFLSNFMFGVFDSLRDFHSGHERYIGSDGEESAFINGFMIKSAAQREQSAECLKAYKDGYQWAKNPEIREKLMPIWVNNNQQYFKELRQLIEKEGIVNEKK